MLKKSAGGVLGSSTSSTCPWGCASGFDSPAACRQPFWASCCHSGFNVAESTRATFSHSPSVSEACWPFRCRVMFNPGMPTSAYWSHGCSWRVVGWIGRI